MNTVKLLKLAPMLIMIAFLAYTVYSIHASLPAPTAGQSDPKKGLEIMVDDVLNASAATARSLASEGLRNPFLVRTKPGMLESQDVAALDPVTVPLAEIVRGLTLEATFLQGRDQMAIIDGRVYSQGQHLFLEGDAGDAGKSVSELSVASVLPAKVILQGGGQNYELSYPDQLGRRADKTRRAGAPSGGQPPLSQTLLRSPLGELVKSVIGGTAQPASTPRSRRHRG
ncbi:MAG: hypothetical protein ACHRXM_04110 [Isosphaerales bacterium]